MPKEIQLTRGKVCIVDDDDFEKFGNLKWHYNGEYAVRSENKPGIGKRKKMLHRYILPVTGNLTVDHINGDKLDNRKCNLRLASHSQNRINYNRSRTKSKYRGVSYLDGSWRVVITYQGKRRVGGYFKCDVDAAKRYNELAIELHGEFAVLNEIPS